MNGILKTTLFLFFLSFFFSFHLNAQCVIYNIHFELHDCDSDGNFLIDIEFDHEATGNEGYSVTGNGNDYGDFSYDDPFITIGPLDGDGAMVYEFLISDNQFGCSENFLIDAPACYCDISNFTLTPETCGPDSLFSVLVEFDHQFTPSDSFRLKDVTPNVNSVPWGIPVDATYAYSDLPILIGPFLKDHLFLPTRSWKVWDKVDDACEELAEVDYGCNCQFLNINTQVIDCNDEGEFFVTVDFDVANNFVNAFTVLQNGDLLGSYPYSDLPVDLGPFTGNSDDIELVVIDTVLGDCHANIEFDHIICDPVNVDCHIFDVIAEIHPCEDDGTFYVDIDFEYENVGNEGFRIQGNGNNYGNFSYDEPFITLGPFDGSIDVLEFVVIDNQLDDCSDYIGIDAPDCNLPCEITNFVIEVGECKTQNSYELTILIEAENTPNDWVDLKYGGLPLGLYHLNDFPITIPNFYDFGESSPLIFANILDSDCFDFGTFDAPNCDDHPNDCFIGSPFSFNSNCNDDGTFDITMFLDIENAGNDFFDVSYNGNLIGTYPVGQMPFTLNNFQPNNEPFPTLTICINDNPDCCRQLVIENPCYGQGCEIWDIIFEPHNCDDEGNYLMDIAFESNHTGMMGFSVFGNGHNYGSFDYDAPFITVGPLPGDGSINEFVIVDNQFPDCQNAIDFDPIYCDQNDCEIVHVEFEVGDCNDNGTYQITVGFEYQNANNDFYELWANDEYLGFFPLNQNPFTIDEFPASGNEYDKITICINDNPDCCVTFDFLAPNCNNDDCEIWDMNVEIGDCNDDGSYHLWLNFEHANATNDLFEVYVGNDLIGTYLLNELPIHIEDFPLTGNNQVGLVACIFTNNTECCELIEFEEPDCPVGDCEIFDFWVEIGDCNDDGTFPLWFGFEVVSPTQNHFDLIRDGEIIGFYSLDELPINLPHYDGSNTGLDQLTVCINDNPDCCATIEFDVPICDQICNISELWVEPIECDTLGGFYIELGFEYEDVGMEGFSVVGNGEDYGDFEYAALPITIGPLESGGDFVYEFIVIDNQVDNCEAEIGFGPWFCDDECHINSVTASVSDCNDQGEFFVTLDVLYQNVGDEGFIVQGNGNNYGNFEYADLPITLGPFEGDGVTEYEFVVIDLAIDDCQNWASIEPVECPVVDCEIVELWVDIGDCNDDGTYNLWFNIEVVNPGNDFIDVFVGDDFLGFYSLNDLPVFIENYPASGQPVDELTICINDNEDCCKTIEFDAPDCNLAWPGDANDDNIANNFDLLNIGLAYGIEGSERPTQGIEWTGLVSEDWAQFFENDANFKHADCNGNGIVSDGDIEAIIINYDQTHGDVHGYEPPTPTDDDPAFFVDLPAAEDITFGVPFTAPIILGTEMQPLEDIYGIAFTLNFDPDIINPASIEITYDPSWIGAQPVNLIKLDRTKANEGKVEVALSRIDQNNVSGFGEIAAFIGIIDDIAGKQDMSIEISHVKAIMNNEALIPLRTPTEVVELVTNVNNPNQDIGLEIFPNPTSDIIHIKNSMNHPIEFVEIQDINGRIIERHNDNNHIVSLKNIPTGMYIIRVKIEGRTFNERIIKMQKN